MKKELVKRLASIGFAEHVGKILTLDEKEEILQIWQDMESVSWFEAFAEWCIKDKK